MLQLTRFSWRIDRRNDAIWGKVGFYCSRSFPAFWSMLKSFLGPLDVLHEFSVHIKIYLTAHFCRIDSCQAQKGRKNVRRFTIDEMRCSLAIGCATRAYSNFYDLFHTPAGSEPTMFRFSWPALLNAVYIRRNIPLSSRFVIGLPSWCSRNVIKARDARWREHESSKKKSTKKKKERSRSFVS